MSAQDLVEYVAKSLVDDPDSVKVDVVLEPDGTVITGRDEHGMLGLSARPTPNGIQISSRDGEAIEAATPADVELEALWNELGVQ